MGYIINEPIIQNESPFKDIRLNRWSECNILTNIIDTCDGEGVIALNGTWGCGKTTFLKIWCHHLEAKGYTSLYFNAWENDYLSDPLIGLLGELKEEGWLVKTSNEGEKLMQSTLRVIGTAMKSAVKYKIKDVTGVDCDEVVDTIQNEFFNDEFDSYTREKSPIVNFRDALTKIIQANTEDDKPLVFIVDELDRCNPTYAVKMLERVKHLFSIPNVVFVLSIDKEQLANSVRGFYGSEQINAEEYLRRFIDIEYNLPKLDTKVYFEYLNEKLEIDKLFKDLSNRGGYEYIVPKQIDDKAINLRQVQKLLTAVKLALRASQPDLASNADIFFLLAYLRMANPVFYAQIKAHSLSMDDYVKGLEDLFAEDIAQDNSDYNNTSLYHRFGELILLYNNHRNETYQVPQLLKYIDVNNKDSMDIDTQDLTFNTTCINRAKLKDWMFRNHNYNSAIDINFFISKLELRQNLIR